MKKLLLTITLAASLTGIAGLQAEDALAIVVSKTCAVDSISSAELQKIFKAEKTKGPDGSKVVVVMRDAGSPERDAALAGILKMSEAEYKKYFLQATFTGAVQNAPKTLSSSEAVKQFVTTTTGGIGYIKSSDIDESVKILKVDNKAPTDPDYPLKLRK